MQVIEQDAKFYIGPFDTEEAADQEIAQIESTLPKEVHHTMAERFENLVAKLRHHGIPDADQAPEKGSDAEPEAEAEGAIRPIKNPSYPEQPVEFENAILVPEPEPEKAE